LLLVEERARAQVSTVGALQVPINMNENHDIGTKFDLQTPLLSSSQKEEVDESRFPTLDESEAESRSRNQEAHRLTNRSDTAESFLRHSHSHSSSSSIDRINYVHQASFTSNRILPRDAPFYQSKVREKGRYRYNFVYIRG
jgi:hypothetical protein